MRGSIHALGGSRRYLDVRLFLSAKVWNGSRLLLTFERFYCLLRLDVCWIINDKEEKFRGNVCSLREYRLGLMK